MSTFSGGMMLMESWNFVQAAHDRSLDVGDCFSNRAEMSDVSLRRTNSPCRDAHAASSLRGVPPRELRAFAGLTTPTLAIVFESP